MRRKEKIAMLVAHYKRAGIEQCDSLEEMAEKQLAQLEPEVSVVEQSNDKLVIEITSSVDASLFDGITCGNRHVHAYTCPDGKLSALTRIGHCDLAVSTKYENAILTDISQISFTRQAKLGETARITVERIPEKVRAGKRMTRTISRLTGEFVSSGEVAFAPCEVTSVQFHPRG